MSTQLIALAAMAAEEHEVNHGLAWGIGGLALGLLILLLIALLTFGGGREHS